MPGESLGEFGERVWRARVLKDSWFESLLPDGDKRDWRPASEPAVRIPVGLHSRETAGKEKGSLTKVE